MKLELPHERDLPRASLQRRKEHLVAEIASTLPARRRRLALVLLPAVFLLLAGTGGAAYVLTRPATQLESIGCYARADVDADTVVERADGRDPASVCAELWRDGTLGHRVPPLASCVLPSGAVGVFPGGEETCTGLGLDELRPGYRAEARRFAGLRDALSARLSGRCIGKREANAIVRRTLDARGYRDWRIEAGGGIGGEGFSAARPCAGLAFDGERRVVILVPEPR